MNKFLILILLSISFISCADKKSKKHQERLVRVYENALRMGDVNVAINACYEIIANDSALTNYYDTLVYLYLNTRNEGSTYQVARMSLKYKPDNDKMTRVVAEFAKTLGMPDTAIVYYKKTFVLNNKLENLYDIAQVQYNAGNDAAAEETADMIIKSSNSDKEMITIALGDEVPQQIPVKAAAYNIKGTVFIALGSKETALRYFDEALKISPEFSVAKKNKEEILSGKIKFVK